MRNFLLGFALVVTISLSLIGYSQARLNNPPASGVSGASTALDNLASVAINISLLSDANNTDDLGAFGFAWKDLFASGTAYISTIDTDTSGLVLKVNGTTRVAFQGVNAIFTASVDPSTNNARNLGRFTKAWQNIYVSSTAWFGDNTASSSINIDRRAIYEIVYKTIIITSSTLEAFNGLTVSSTIDLGVASPHGEEWDSITCYTNEDTAEIEFGDGTNFMDYQKVTTAILTDASLSNNAFISREKRVLRVGQWGTADTLSCTIGIIELQD